MCVLSRGRCRKTLLSGPEFAGETCRFGRAERRFETEDRKLLKYFETQTVILYNIAQCSGSGVSVLNVDWLTWLPGQ